MIERSVVYTEGGIVQWSYRCTESYIREIEMAVRKNEKSVSGHVLVYREEHGCVFVLCYHPSFPVQNADDILSRVGKELGEKHNLQSEFLDSKEIEEVFWRCVKEEPRAETTEKKRPRKKSVGVLMLETGKKTSGSSFLDSLSGMLPGTGCLEKKHVKGALEKIKEKLIEKNVSVVVADEICQEVEKRVVGKKRGWSDVVRSSMVDFLMRKIQTEKSESILSDIEKKKGMYRIMFVGVNGVGKTTTVAKICFWLLNSGNNVLVAGCDTFRSGALEQLQEHTRRLNEAAESHGGTVELFERGYGREPAKVGKEALRYGESTGADVLVVDTAGRMPENKKLMSELVAVVRTTKPDRIVFVGECLTGNSSVTQIEEFNKAFSLCGRRIDGLILSKWDSVEGKIGSALTMGMTARAPILFIGTGQGYDALREINTEAITDLLL
ncbi:MAG: Signal recognition particle receptor subunit alpha [Amphiamblys sp. WSBS2006]|nr:MAG: Signal recognition particle receptor subunit alpha [Amphiamblys sp. WSBS2006]